MSGLLAKIFAIVAGLSLIASVYLYKVNTSLTKEVSKQTTDIKALTYGTASYRDEANKWHSVSIEQIKTVAELKQGKDSVSIEYNKLLKQYKIKPKEVTALGTVQTRLITDTTVKYVATAKDTTYNLSSLPYIKESIHIKNDSLSRDLEINNKQSIVWHTKRETIDPPKRFFLLRWFQKKHDVTYVEIVNDNPFIKTTNQDFRIISK